MSTVAEQTTQLASNVEELTLYWPALAGALGRDQGSTSAAGSSATSSPVLSAPVNLDVLRATTTLQTEVPATAQWCCRIVRERHAQRPVGDHLPHFPRWHTMMLGARANRLAEQLVKTVYGWWRLAKTAIGLLVVDRPLGQHCPVHDDPLVELVAPGDEGWLRLRTGDPGPTVSWVHVHAVLCRHCRTRWTPPQYLWLGRLLRDADRRRAAAAAAAQQVGQETEAQAAAA